MLGKHKATRIISNTNFLFVLQYFGFKEFIMPPNLMHSDWQYDFDKQRKVLFLL